MNDRRHSPESGFLRVERAGPLALLQDAGRFGVRRLGVTQGGPADLHAWAWANRLVGNPWGCAVLEITLGAGLTLVAEHDMVLAVAGADLEAMLDGRPVALWQAFRISAGQRLGFGTPRNGIRAYLAVAGGFRAEPVLDSVACVQRDRLGGLDGQGSKLATGDRLPVLLEAQQLEAQQRPMPAGAPPRPEAARPDYRAPPQLALVPGAQISAFDGGSLYQAFNSPWQVDPRADRMGVRLQGPKLLCDLQSMISEGIALGAVQVPPDGQPIVLLNDRQTIGGYPRLGTLTPLACSRLAQCAPGQEVRLVAEGADRAERSYRQFRRAFG